VTAEPGWVPATEIGQSRVCQRVGCGREFKPAAPGDIFCSSRCAGLSARAVAVAPLDLDGPDDDDDDGLAQEHPAPAEPPAAAKVCVYGPCDLPPMLSGQRHGWQAKYCSWGHVLAAKAKREAGNGQVPAKVHTPDPEDERSGAAGALAGSLLNQGETTGLEASPPRTPPDDDPGLITSRTVQLSSGAWLSVTLAVDLFALDQAERELVFALVDAVNAHVHAQGAPL
jgi:hypothetical protein